MFTNEKKLTFPVSTGLIAKQHFEKIGPALWEFLWCIDRITEEIEGDGERWGKVLGGRAIKAKDIAETFGMHEKTVKEHISKLAEHGYIRLKRLQHGQAIDVRKSIKWQMRLHGASTTSPSNRNEVSELVDKLRTIPGVVAQDRDFGVMGKLCDEFGTAAVGHAVVALQEAMAKASIRNPLGYLSGILKQIEAQPKAVPAAKSDITVCPKCLGKGTYLREVPFMNGLETRLESVVCECKKKRSWANKLSVAT